MGRKDELYPVYDLWTEAPFHGAVHTVKTLEVDESFVAEVKTAMDNFYKIQRNLKTLVTGGRE